MSLSKLRLKTGKVTLTFLLTCHRILGYTDVENCYKSGRSLLPGINVQPVCGRMITTLACM